MNKVIVIGATSMIGLALIDNLVDKKINVVGTLRQSSPKKKFLTQSKFLKLIECDLSKIEKLDVEDRNFDVMYYFAWSGVYGDERNDVILQKQNIDYMLNALKVANTIGCKKFVFAGSQAEYGLQDKKLTCLTLEKPLTAYGIAKYASSKLGKLYADKIGIEFVVGRILSAYGEHDTKTTLISVLIQNFLKNQDVNLSACDQIWDYINVKDVAEAFYLLGEKGINGKAYPVGSGLSKPLKEFVEIIYNIVGNKNVKINYGNPIGNNAVKFLQTDLTELTKDTGFMPKVSFEKGIRDMVQSIKEINE